MKRKRLIVFTIFTIIIICSVFLYSHYSPGSADSLVPLSHSPITLGENEKIYFYEGGFAISGTYSRFYDPNGNSITPPFSDEMGSNGQFVINMASPNFMLVDGKSIYKTSGTPFEKIYELEVTTGCGIQEFSDYLAILVQDENGILIPKILDLNQGILTDLKDVDTLYYMDGDYDSESKSFSLLALSLETYTPSSKVLNYMNGISLYSVISSTNEAYYKILRLPSHLILVGTHEIRCYNIDGTLQWSINNKEIKGCKIVKTNKGFLFYFPYPIDNGDGIFFNALAINQDSSYAKLDYPGNITDLQPYGNYLIGLRYGRNIVVLNENGSIKQEFYVSEDIISLYYSKYHEHNLYLLDRDNQLHIYSTKREDSGK